MTFTYVCVIASYFVSGVALIVVGWLSARRRLRRNRFAGIRTRATMASDEAFKVGNAASAGQVVAAGWILVVGAGAAGASWAAGVSFGAAMATFMVPVAATLAVVLWGAVRAERAVAGIVGAASAQERGSA
jgi:uncharacterized membrane protein